MKDDFDTFVEEAEIAVKLLEQGVDVSQLSENLLKHAETIDPNNIPTTAISPEFFSSVIATLVSTSPNTSFASKTSTSETRQRIRSTRMFFDDEIDHSETPLTISPSPSIQPSEKSNYIIYILFICILCFLYWYFLLPETCPRPVW